MTAQLDAGAGTPALPLHLCLVGRRVVVVGGGEVGTRKICHALAAGASVTLVSPQAGPVLRDLAASGQIRWVRRGFRRRDLRAAWLVYAATGVEPVDQLITAVAERRRVFCVRADRGTAGSARSAAVLRRQGVVIGVSSESGPDPRRTTAVRDALTRLIDSGELELPGAQRRLLDLGGPVQR